MKQIGIWAGIIAVIVGTIWGLIILVNGNPPAATTLQTNVSNTPPAPVSKEDMTLGSPEKAKVTLIEYADFQCPACKIYAPFIDQLEKDFGEKILIVYRFFPLTNLHQNAMAAAQAAFAANKQGKFWQMYNLLYQNQDTWATSPNAQAAFTNYAKLLGLNINQFTADYNSDSTKNFINAEESEGISIGVNSTPTLFINKELITENPTDYSDLKSIIQDAIKK